MKLYAAPMEGLTGFAWRKTHRQYFGGADKYYTPFLVANTTGRFKTKEIREITQEGDSAVPQLLASNPKDFLWAAKELQSMGFDEINLNLGCPSGTVVSKGRGSGALKDLKTLDALFAGIFEELPDINLSVKTRTGFEDSSLWPQILAVFEKYPISELIVHSRVKVQFYEGIADRKLFKETMAQTKHPLVYNGDVNKADDEAFFYGCGVMAGRGLIADPSLFRQVKGGKPASRSELLEYHDALEDAYRAYMPGDVPTLHHMKEFWFYYSGLFDEPERTLKKPMKATSLREYNIQAHEILKNGNLVHNCK